MTTDLLIPEHVKHCEAAITGYSDDGSFISLIDLLADARHWCDANNQDYADLDRIAYQHYLACSSGPQNQPAMGALKTSHFEETQIRRIGSKGIPFPWSRIMSNLLKVAMIDLILSLHRQGWSQRRIASELGINRETVARYLQQVRGGGKTSQCAHRLDRCQTESKPANAPPGSITARGRVKTSQCALRLGRPLRHGQTPTDRRPRFGPGSV